MQRAQASKHGVDVKGIWMVKVVFWVGDVLDWCVFWGGTPQHTCFGFELFWCQRFVKAFLMHGGKALIMKPGEARAWHALHHASVTRTAA